MNKEISYNKQIVAFIDLLGFKNIVNEVNKDKNKAIGKINYLIDIIEKSIKSNIYIGDEESDYLAVEYKIFSDCICLSMDCVEPYEGCDTSIGIYLFLSDLIKIQARLVMDNIFIRGAVTIDNHFLHDNLIFSAALNNAYKSESTRAVNPRVVIDESIIEVLSRYQDPYDSDVHFSNYNKIIKRDSDGLLFLDYLEYCDDNEVNTNDFIELHKNIIEERLENEDDPYIISKYLWVANYHNQKVSELLQKNICLENKYINKVYTCYKDDVFSVWYLFVCKIINSNEKLLVIVEAGTKDKAMAKINEYMKLEKYEIFDNLEFLFLFDDYSLVEIENSLSKIKVEFNVKQEVIRIM